MEHSKIIPCETCEKEKIELERNGAATVVSCKVFPEDRDKPKSEQRCLITWKMKAIFPIAT